MDSSDEDFLPSKTSRQKARDVNKRKERSKSSDEIDEDRKKRAESSRRKAKSRRAMSEDQRALMREKDRLRKAATKADRARAAISDEKREELREQDRIRKATAKARESDRTNRATARAALPEERRKEIRETDRARRERARAEMSEDQQAMIQEQDRLRKRLKRDLDKTKVTCKDGLKSAEILQGKFKVVSLENSADSIGDMTVKCQDCGAFKFKNETPGICCSNGKIDLPVFPPPPGKIMDFWTGDDLNSKLFRKYSKELNNAVCLSSIQVKIKNFQGFTPAVIFQGKVQHFAGALQPADGETPRFAQLYVHDPQMEFTQRYENMVLPSSTSRSDKSRLKQILPIIQEEIHQHNPFVQDFKQIVEISDDLLADGKIVISATKKPSKEHKRRYNLQTCLNEVSILTNFESHDLVLHKRGGGLETVHDLNPKGMPLHFTLLFPHGTYGWDPNTKQFASDRRVTTRQFYSYHLHKREGNNQDFLHKAGKLFQEWTCMSYVTVENQRLNYQDMNQKALRADSYKSVKEATEERIREAGARADQVHNDDHQNPTIGRKILASSFVGSPRWYNMKFQNGMRIVGKFRKPDLFITMTCNPKWPEILKELKPGQTPQDRPDIVARVFKQRLDQLMKDLINGQLLGKVVAFMWVIEWQKRGLPHAHILIILAENDRQMTAEFVDSIICAELPPDPETIADPEERQLVQELDEIVTKNMIHGPCGQANPSAPCMENGKCTKNFPKEFVKETIVDTENNYATYRRRSPADGGRQIVKDGRTIDNSWVVPYNPYLSKRHNCHINVESCVSPKATKYLFKYVTKGNDRAMVTTEVEGQPRNEIQEYVDLRYIGSPEAAHHLFAFPITDMFPHVFAMRVHLEEQQQVVFDEGTELEALENQRETELTAFFQFNEVIK